MQQRSFLSKLVLWGISAVLLLGAGGVLVGEDFFELLLFYAAVFLGIPFLPSLLFAIPFASRLQKSLTELPDGRIQVSQGQLWQSLRGWVTAWLVLACVSVLGSNLWAPFSGNLSFGYRLFVWGCYGGITLLYFYTPLIYQAIAGLLIARHCRNTGVLVTGMLLIGNLTYLLVLLTLYFLVELSPGKLFKFTLPNSGYNPGFPEPEAALCYTAVLGAGLLWWTMRQTCTEIAAVDRS